MSLQLTNTLTRQKEPFSPIVPGHVKIYCCGVTVYDLCHLGHARSYIVWDVLRRYLLWQGYKVTFVQNFTDIDDKILNKASKEECSMGEVSQRNILAFYKDMDALGILRADRMPRATQCLDQIRSLISQLEQKGAAYSIDGDVYFSVMKYAEYGKLSRRVLQEQQLNPEGRISEEEETRKKHPFDFALWKSSKKGEPSYPSPWGNGRPGWHIECSAMVREELGNTIDIHLGGADLIFPHHENEIAQSEVASGLELAHYWLHNGMVNVEGQKMSKSLGNFTTIRSLLDKGISPMTMRIFILQAHYRKPLDFTTKALKAASVGWEGLNRALSLGTIHGKKMEWPEEHTERENESNFSEDQYDKTCLDFKKKFEVLMNDDLNTSGALSVLFELARPLKSLSNHLNIQGNDGLEGLEIRPLFKRWKLLVNLSNSLGLKAEFSKENPQKNGETPNKINIEKAIAERKKAKLNKDFAKADRIREELTLKGIQLIDKPGGITTWNRI